MFPKFLKRKTNPNHILLRQWQKLALILKSRKYLFGREKDAQAWNCPFSSCVCNKLSSVFFFNYLHRRLSWESSSFCLLCDLKFQYLSARACHLIISWATVTHSTSLQHHSFKRLHKMVFSSISGSWNWSLSYSFSARHVIGIF